MANEEALGPRKTMFVLVIVVGCFAVLWPRILSPLILGSNRELKPNQFDRDAGCCEVIFETEVAIHELLNEVCGASLQANGRLSPHAAAECRQAVNETCGMDIAAFLKRSDNVGKTTKVLLDTMRSSNSSCLKEHFGVPVWSTSSHLAVNYWMQQDTLKQERPAVRGGSHPALRERGRAIPVTGTPPPAPRPTPLPPHVRVRSSPLSVYYELDIKPPPIPGMRPPLGAPGGPVTAPKSSMGILMPIYTICIVVFFVYTLSKILFRRTGPVTYETVTPDPQFRRRVFRDDSRTSPERLVVTAISGLVAEVQQQMEASYAQNQQRQDAQDNNARPYTNGTILHTGPVQIVASEYMEPSKDKSPEPVQKEPVVETKESPEPKELSPEPKELSPEPKELSPEPKELSPEPKELSPDSKELSPEPHELSPEPEEPKEIIPAPEEPVMEPKKSSPERKVISPEVEEIEEEEVEEEIEEEVEEEEIEELRELDKSPEIETNHKEKEVIPLSQNIEAQKNIIGKESADFLTQERETLRIVSTPEMEHSTKEKQSTPELLEEALREDSPTEGQEETDGGEQENASVKVIGMEVTAHAADGGAWPRAEPPPVTPMPPLRPSHEADQVKSIYLETEIPQKSRVLVADFADRTDKPTATKNAPLVVSGKMTLSLIQDVARETPERDPESVLDEFTTASGLTQLDDDAQKDGDSEDDVEEEVEVEEIEVEEIEIEEEEEEQLESDPEPAEDETITKGNKV